MKFDAWSREGGVKSRNLSKKISKFVYPPRNKIVKFIDLVEGERNLLINRGVKNQEICPQGKQLRNSLIHCWKKNLKIHFGKNREIFQLRARKTS